MTPYHPVCVFLFFCFFKDVYIIYPRCQQFLSILVKSLSLRYNPLLKHGVQMCVYPLISSDNGRLILGIKRPVNDLGYIKRNTSSLRLIASRSLKSDWMFVTHVNLLEKDWCGGGGG